MDPCAVPERVPSGTKKAETEPSSRCGISSVGDRIGTFISRIDSPGETLLTWRPYPSGRGRILRRRRSSSWTSRFNLARSSPPANAGLQDPREAYLKIGSLCPSHYVFHSGCSLSNNCHPPGKMDGKTKSLYPVAEVDRLTKPLLFTRSLCRATRSSRTGEAGRSLFDRYGSDRSGRNGVGHR